MSDINECSAQDNDKENDLFQVESPEAEFMEKVGGGVKPLFLGFSGPGNA